MNAGLIALMWDFDGTLVDSSERNFRVAKRIIRESTGKGAETHACLVSLEDYEVAVRSRSNWRDLYMGELGMSAEEADRVGRLWTPYQLEDETPMRLFRGIAKTVASLSYLPQGIVSQNSRRNISRTLKQVGIERYFKSVLGYEQVPLDRQKPHPDGLLECLEALTDGHPGISAYVGDHQTDFECVNRANEALVASDAQVRMVSIGVTFDSALGDGRWEIAPHYHAEKPRDVAAIVERLESRGQDECEPSRNPSPRPPSPR